MKNINLDNIFNFIIMGGKLYSLFLILVRNFSLC